MMLIRINVKKRLIYLNDGVKDKLLRFVRE